MKSKATRANPLSRAALRREAGARSFERGAGYFKSGKVSSLIDHEGILVAKVQGTRSYRVKLFFERKRIRCDCNCPLGQGGVFCKHGVAAGLAWLHAKPGLSPGKKPARSSEVTMEDVRACLLSQDKSTLAGMLMEQAMDDDKLRRRLLLTVAKKSARGADLDTYRKAIDQAVNEEVEDYKDVFDYASGIGEGIDSIEELLKEGRASEALELSEYAFQAVEGAMGSVDDSDGHVGGLLERLQDIHLKACRKAKPDPVALAGRLFEWELRGNWGAFHGAAKTYASLLGNKGMAEYRKLAEAEWAKVPPLQGSGRDAGGYGSRSRITQLMETLAKESGDVEALVSIQKRDLSSPRAYLRIAEAYKEKGKGSKGKRRWNGPKRDARPFRKTPISVCSNSWPMNTTAESGMTKQWRLPGSILPPTRPLKPIRHSSAIRARPAGGRSGGSRRLNSCGNSSSRPRRRMRGSGQVRLRRIAPNWYGFFCGKGIWRPLGGKRRPVAVLRRCGCNSRKSGRRLTPPRPYQSSNEVLNLS